MSMTNVFDVTDVVSVDPTFVYISLVIIAAGVILMWLMVRSSDQFTVEDTEENAEDFAEGAARESRGPVLMWLWVAYAGMIVWAIAYLIQHSAEFATFP